MFWIDFDPKNGREIQKHRPSLVVSNHAFNAATKFAVICLITSTMKQSPDRYTLKNSKTQGQVVINQLKSLDYQKRHISFIEKIEASAMGMIYQVISYIFLAQQG
ncbi:type II toxin-antitoxin system PemK/MazF family toxin [Aerococcaceae bacterium DSM 111020]|nr:type II toxin-antitoxin system PemK/MazF family toxin [Aerococcaceae bacterium DSM 111020]